MKRFPTELRKMWTGAEVQAWIDENWNSAQPEPRAPGKLDKPAMVGNVRFSKGVSVSTVIQAAQDRYATEITPEKEAIRSASRKKLLEGLRFGPSMAQKIHCLYSEEAERDRQTMLTVRLPAGLLRHMHISLVVRRRELEGFIALGNELKRAAEIDRWIEQLEAEGVTS